MKGQNIGSLVLTSEIAKGCEGCPWKTAEGNKALCTLSGHVLRYMANALPQDHSRRDIFQGEAFLLKKKQDLLDIPEGQCQFCPQTLELLREGHLPSSIGLLAPTAHQYQNMESWTERNPIRGITYIPQPLDRSIEITYS